MAVNRKRVNAKRDVLGNITFHNLLSRVKNNEIVVSTLYEKFVKTSSSQFYSVWKTQKRNLRISYRGGHAIVYRAEIKDLETQSIKYAYLSTQQKDALCTIQRPTPVVVPIEHNPNSTEEGK